MDKLRKPEEVFGGTTEQILKEKLRQQGMSLSNAGESSAKPEQYKRNKTAKEVTTQPETEKQKEAGLVKIQRAREHLLLLLQGKLNAKAPYKVFKKLGQDYTLSQIAAFLDITRLQVVDLLDEISGFERVNVYGTQKATAFKLITPEKARLFLEQKLKPK